MDAVSEEPSPHGMRRGPSSSRRSGTASEDAEKVSGRRKACNECKQQKLRCDLASKDATAADICGRCKRLGLGCKIENGFRRTRKRRRSADLENELRELRKQLAEKQTSTTNDLQPPSIIEPAEPNWALPLAHEGPNVASDFGTFMPSDTAWPAPPSVPAGVGPQPIDVEGANLSEESPAAHTDATEHSRAPGLTTRPGVDETGPRRSISSALPRPRALGNTALSVDEIDDLFRIFLANYHPFLPLVDERRSPHEYYQTSELLFWSVISVAARRMTAQPTLLQKLARSVTDLLWKTLRSIPYSLATVQSLAILCTWPFPTSSSTADPTFMLVGTMLQIGTQMGLHRALDAQDFAKVPTRLNLSEYAEWVRTWETCKIVAQSVSIGCGLPLFIQPYEWTAPSRPEVDVPGFATTSESIRFHLRVERIRLQISASLGLDLASIRQSSFRERLTAYNLLNSHIRDLENEGHHTAKLGIWYLTAARLHLHAFYLFDDAHTEGYKDRIMTLYLTAYSLIDLSLKYDSDETGFLHYFPFFCYQVFVCAAFVILKILMNGFFRPLLDVEAGTKLLEASIAALRKISVVNNDLPARLGDVIGFFCALSDPTVVGGATAEGLRLDQVKNRLSMSVVYDCLWTWRKHFQVEENEAVARNGSNDGEDEFRTSIAALRNVADLILARMVLSPEDMQSLLGFNFPTGMSGFLDIDLAH